MLAKAKLKSMSPSPRALKPAGLWLPLTSVRFRGSRAYIAGHVPLNPEGLLASLVRKVGGVGFSRAGL